MVWSGVTKYMRTVCTMKHKAVDLPGVGIFVPMQEIKGQKLETKNLTSAALKEFKEEDNDVKLYLYKDFVDQTNVKINASNNSSLIEVYDPDHAYEEAPVFLLNASPINHNSIAKVCETDAFSVA